MQLSSHDRFTRGTEGVGFEPTVGCPTLDFESSALNRTQPPFLEAKENAERRTSNIQRRMQLSSKLGVGQPARRIPCAKAGLSVCNLGNPVGRSRSALADRIVCLTKQKNVTIKGLPCLASLLHLVCPHGQPRYYLLLTGIHRFLAPLFTSIPNY
jgi:hypothetical protein